MTERESPEGAALGDLLACHQRAVVERLERKLAAWHRSWEHNDAMNKDEDEVTW